MKITQWKMNFLYYGELDCTVPCSMYSVLLEHKKIDDPFYGMNELEALKLSEEDCSFYTTFEVTSEDFAKDYAELVFHGLDTICEIYLNDEELGYVLNMHREHVFDVKGKIKAGKNTLRLEFKSPIEYFNKRNDKHYLHMSWHSLAGCAHLRKGLSMSGWDWGPKLPDMGIFRDVELRCYNTDRIEDVLISQEHKKDGTVIVTVRANSAKNSDCVLYAELDGKRAEFKNGRAKITVENPELWWPRGYGEQKLYDLTVVQEKNGAVIDSVTKRIGLRTLTVSTGLHHDYEFCFVVNGVRIFMMGANYVPQDNILPRITPETTRKLLDAVCDGNQNCIRVWGGGYYPEDYFFDMCDELGLVVWEDFMLACASVWLTEKAEAEMRLEATYNVKRIHHHASLGLLCGNNEVEQVFLVEHVRNDKIVADYIRLYEGILPDICEEYAPDTFYWPSSPSAGGGFKYTHDKDKGDSHYWEVWHNQKPFTEYRKYKFRFCSEYGFESFPNIKTIKSFCEEEDMNPFSQVMENHQKGMIGTTKILGYLADTYKYPYNMEDFVYASQLLQADAIKYGVQHFRRTRGYCMGSIYWQLNDCWPVASWSSIDYYGRYKALHYASKKFYAPVATGLFHENGKIVVNLANEQRKEFAGTIKMYIRKNNFDLIHSDEVSFTVDELSSTDVASVSDKYVECPEDTYFYADLYDEKGNFVMRETLLFTRAKHFKWLKPEIKVECKNCEGGVAVTLSSDNFAKSVFMDFEDIDVLFSDNYIDLTDEAPVTVIAKTDLDAKVIKEKLKIKTVYEIGRTV